MELKLGIIQKENDIDNSNYLIDTELLDFKSAAITKLIDFQQWKALPTESEMIKAIYTYVRDEIPYGFPKVYAQKASEVLSTGVGNSFTKSVLLMALLRSVGVPCRMKASLEGRLLFRGLAKGLAYRILPSILHHACLEVWHNNKWVETEGHIIDLPYLKNLQIRFPNYMGSFFGYGIAVLNFKNPPIEWTGSETYIQSKAIEEELGIFTNPDDFLEKYSKTERFSRGFYYRSILRPRMNRIVEEIRNS